MNLSIFHSVNAGLYFWDGEHGLLVDGIHDGRKEGLSPMPAFLAGQLSRHTGIFAHLNGVAFTHLHNDHYDENGLHTLLRGLPGLPVYGPGLSENSALVRPIRFGLCSIRMGNIGILARDTLHDGEAYRNDFHQSFLIRMGGESVFVAGDALLQPCDADDLTGFYDAPIEAAFCNLYQLASPDGQEFLRELAPKRVFLYHLPFPEDDRYCYHKLARQALKRYPSDLPPVEKPDHMSWVDDRVAQWDERKGEEWNGLSGIAQH